MGAAGAGDGLTAEAATATSCSAPGTTGQSLTTSDSQEVGSTVETAGERCMGGSSHSTGGAVPPPVRTPGGQGGPVREKAAACSNTWNAL